MGRLQVRSTLFFSCFLASSVQADLVISSGRSLGLQACRSVDFASLQCHVFFRCNEGVGSEISFWISASESWPLGRQ